MGEVAYTEPRQLRDSDSLEGFTSGTLVVDEWLQKHARKARHAGTAIVYVSFASNRLAGYYTLSAQSVARTDVKGWLSRNVSEQMPVILLGMLGVDKLFQGQGLGRNLLLDASKRALAVSQAIGARALVVDPIGDEAARFYRSCGFRGLPGTTRMFAKLR